ncbi:MAG: hypothetical protein ISQ23_02320 [Alphaproteobacteria bacterium]|nr:hypothetical protein [Alphaproteobacteria bacterium]
MAKKPKNDNLVMESIEDLFNQADSISETEKSRIKREQPKNMPIIGAQPIRIKDGAPVSAELLVLAGQKRPLSEQAEALFSIEPSMADAPISNTPTSNAQDADSYKSETGDIESDNPFLAIRQAVISAGEPTPSDAPLKANKREAGAPTITETEKKSGKRANLKGQNFTDQIAQLIDNEIEVRLKAQLSIIALANHPAKALTTAEEDNKNASSVKKQRKSGPKTAQKKQAQKQSAQKQSAQKQSAQKKLVQKKQKKTQVEAKPVTKAAAKKAIAKKPLSTKKISGRKTTAKKAARPKKKS